MLKHLLALIALSVAISLGMAYTQQALKYLLAAHDFVALLLSEVFSAGQIGMLLRNFIALLSIPLIVAAIPAMFYWFFRRDQLPYFMEIVWIVWLIQAGALVIQAVIT